MVTGSGRCGTQFMAALLSNAGIRCGHERVYTDAGPAPWGDWQADSSWMAACEDIPVPVVLLVRHPLAVVRSWTTKWLGADRRTPGHPRLRSAAPWIFDHEPAHDRALAMWIALTERTLARAELVVRLERLVADPEVLVRLVRWSGHDPTRAARAHSETGVTDRYAQRRSGLSYEPSWRAHDGELALRGRQLAALLGFDPDEVPGG